MNNINMPAVQSSKMAARLAPFNTILKPGVEKNIFKKSIQLL